MMNLSKKSIYLFETIKLVDKRAQNLSYHTKRAKNSVKKELNFKFEDILKCDLSGLVRAKVVYSEDGELKDLNFYPYKVKKFHKFTLVNADFNYEKKYLDRSKIDSLKGDFDEIIMVKNSLITDTSIANIAIFDGSSWLTPKTPLLKGTFREQLLEKNQILPKDISIDELLKAHKFAIMNAMVGFYEIEGFEFVV